MLDVAKKGDKEQLQSLIRKLEIPNYENLVHQKLGSRKGRELGGTLWTMAHEKPKPV